MEELHTVSRCGISICTAPKRLKARRGVAPLLRALLLDASGRYSSQVVDVATVGPHPKGNKSLVANS